MKPLERGPNSQDYIGEPKKAPRTSVGMPVVGWDHPSGEKIVEIAGITARVPPSTPQRADERPVSLRSAEEPSKVSTEKAPRQEAVCPPDTMPQKAKR